MRIANAAGATNPNTLERDGSISVHNFLNGNLIQYPGIGQSIIYGDRYTTLGKIGQKTLNGGGGVSLAGDFTTLLVSTSAIQNINGINNVKVFLVSAGMPEKASFTVFNSPSPNKIGVKMNNHGWLVMHDAENFTYGNKLGLIKVYKYSGGPSGTYSQIGQDIYTNNWSPGGYGNSVSISLNSVHNYSYDVNNPLYLDRVKIVVGSYYHDLNITRFGLINAFVLDSLQQFIPFGDDFLRGDTIDDQFGLTCDISEDGNHIIGGDEIISMQKSKS